MPRPGRAMQDTKKDTPMHRFIATPLPLASLRPRLPVDPIYYCAGRLTDKHGATQVRALAVIEEDIERAQRSPQDREKLLRQIQHHGLILSLAQATALFTDIDAESYSEAKSFNHMDEV